MTVRILPIMAVALCLLPIGAGAQIAPAPMDDQALDEQRGGLQTPSGMEIGFGATVRTSVDGQVALETRLTWTNQGAQTQNVAGVGSFDPVSGSWSAVVPGASGGTTQIRQDLSANRITSLVINTADNRHIRQDTNITLTLPQLPDLQRQVAADHIAANLQSAIGLALRIPR